ncbi:hypothetical protein Q7P37_006101 [Cladosporium fusiforme]
MGAEASKPSPGTSLLVIGAGLPRTGTASFSEALRILLRKPVYHGGTQICLGPETDVLTWNEILYRNPPEAKENVEFVKKKLKSLLQGFAAVTDCPGHLYVGELMELYPDAKVICTTRDPEKWAKSMGAVSSEVKAQYFLRFALFLLPSLRHFPDYVDAMIVGRWEKLYGHPSGDPFLANRQIYDRHMEYLIRTVPSEKLVFFDVKEGWGPLCKALGVPVPDVEFPRVNDGAATERFARVQVKRGLLRWVAVLGAVLALVVGVVLGYR